MQFRLGKWAAMSLGLLPYSNVGYSMAEYKEDTDYPPNPARCNIMETVDYISYIWEQGLKS